MVGGYKVTENRTKGTTDGAWERKGQLPLQHLFDKLRQKMTWIRLVFCHYLLRCQAFYSLVSKWAPVEQKQKVDDQNAEQNACIAVCFWLWQNSNLRVLTI